MGHKKSLWICLAVLLVAPNSSDACWFRNLFSRPAPACQTCPAPVTTYYAPATCASPCNSCNVPAVPTATYYAPAACSAPACSAPACRSCASPVTGGWQVVASQASVVPASGWAPVKTCATQAGYTTVANFAPVTSAAVAWNPVTPNPVTPNTVTPNTVTPNTVTPNTVPATPLQTVQATPWRPVTPQATQGYNSGVSANQPPSLNNGWVSRAPLQRANGNYPVQVSSIR
jgi:hypothetical protein